MVLTKNIYFAGGCFWGTAHLFSLVPGVESTVAGYANSNIPDPSYRMVCTGHTGAAETVRVTYNPSKVTLSQLIDLYFLSIDPHSVDRQGNDVGTQYRTGIYYTDSADLPAIESAISNLQRRYREPIAVEYMRLVNFYPAEEYHQDYLRKNPQGYCHVDPSLFRRAACTGVTD